ncbi:T9SS type B sorting domain-containing protein [Winogradskyella sp. 3972H.M.0a.05]|uniref:T9SS type B sorting domain-containing protein n=1 Tax=Winogradskyella sp. 3972H.M.0a.05 TaxID=2950277 RepID=UPI0033955195
MKLSIFNLFCIILFANAIVYSQQPNDCDFAVLVCGNSEINVDVSGVGTAELPQGANCGSQENNSIWLQVIIENPGTLGFTLTPDSNAITEDYDFFVFGPNVTCDNLGQSIRCSTTNPQAANQGNNLTGMSLAETDFFEGPGPDGNSFVRYLDVLAGESYFIVIDRPIGNSPFSLEWVGTASFPESPESQVPTLDLSVEECDTEFPFDDGITEFDLNPITQDIIGTQTDILVTYHSTESDANLNLNPLGYIFDNTASPQVVYTRIFNFNSGCFIVEELTLNITPGPEINLPSSFELCDDSIDGDAFNAQTTFDLDIKTGEITNGIINAPNYDISYHLSQDDALNNVAALPLMYYNTIPTPLEVFVRVEDVNDPGCISLASFELNANPPPLTNDITIFQCDDDGIADGFTRFNIDNNLADITDDPSAVTVTYFLSLDDASNNVDAIDGSNFANFENPQTVYALVTDNASGCSDMAVITLDISTTSLPDTSMEACDDDGNEDGIYAFDLTQAFDPIIDGLPTNLELAFYFEYLDALLEVNPIDVNGFENTIPYNQTIYVRAEFLGSCYGISAIDLVVHELPNIETQEDILYCLNDFPQTITLTGGVIDDLPNNYFYQWSTGATTSEIQVNQAGSYSVTVTNTDGCSKQRVINVVPSNIATIEEIQVTDASENNTITALVSGEGDYEYALDNSFGPYQDSNIFENVSIGFHEVFVRDKNDCGIVSQIVSVIGFPKFFTPNDDDVNDFWQVKGISEQFQPNSLILIFTRYGKILAKLDPLGAGWDGTYNGRAMPSDDYWFSVTLEDGRQFNSNFTLRR